MSKELPLTVSTVSAGFPSPADPYIDKKIDLHSYLVAHPEATFFVRVVGESMTGVGILPGDLLVVDRSLKPKNRDVVVAAVAGEFLVKRLCLARGCGQLVAENNGYLPIEITEETVIWGVVVGVVRNLLTARGQRLDT